MIYGYCRVSTTGQAEGNSLEQQEQQILNDYPTAIIYKESYTGTKTDRPIFNQLLDELKSGDMLVVTKLDRFARSLSQGNDLVTELIKKGVRVNILNIGIMDNTANSKLIRNIFLSFAEFERDMIIERTQQGKAIAKANNPNFKEGRPKKFKNGLIELAIQEFESGKSTYADIDNKYGISKSTLYRAMKKRQAEQIKVVEQSKATQSSDVTNSSTTPKANTKLNKIKQQAKELGLTLSIYDEGIENISYKQLNEILDQLQFGTGDVLVSIKRKKYVVEVVIDDNELDLYLLTRDEYESKYGYDLYDEEH